MNLGAKPIRAELKQAGPDGRRAKCLDIVGDGVALAFVENFDEAIVGLAEVDGDWRVVYSADKIVRGLCRHHGMSREDAVEFFEYNIGGAKPSAAMPVFVRQVR